MAHSIRVVKRMGWMRIDSESDWAPLSLRAAETESRMWGRRVSRRNSEVTVWEGWASRCRVTRRRAWGLGVVSVGEVGWGPGKGTYDQLGGSVRWSRTEASMWLSKSRIVELRAIISLGTVRMVFRESLYPAL